MPPDRTERHPQVLEQNGRSEQQAEEADRRNDNGVMAQPLEKVFYRGAKLGPEVCTHRVQHRLFGGGSRVRNVQHQPQSDQ